MKGESGLECSTPCQLHQYDYVNGVGTKDIVRNVNVDHEKEDPRAMQHCHSSSGSRWSSLATIRTLPPGSQSCILPLRRGHR